MKKWQIVLLSVVAVAVVLVGAVALGRGGHEGLATKAEFQVFQTEVNTNISKLTGIVTNMVGEISKIETRRQQDITELKYQAEVKDLKNQVAAGKKETERALESADLKSRLAAAEKSLEEFKRGQYQYIPPVVVSPPIMTAYRSGTIGVNQSGRYTINFQPYSAEFYLDGQRVSNGEQRYLYSGRWYSWLANSEVSFQMVWVGY